MTQKTMVVVFSTSFDKRRNFSTFSFDVVFTNVWENRQKIVDEVSIDDLTIEKAVFHIAYYYTSESDNLSKILKNVITVRQAFVVNSPTV